MSGVVKGLFGSKKVNQPQRPIIEPPPVMPTPDDEQVKRARRRRAAAMVGRSGRLSTLLTDNDGTGLGG